MLPWLFLVAVVDHTALADCAQIFVSNEMSGDVSVIDAASQAVVATIPVGKRPRGLKVSPDVTTVYVALSGSPAGGPGVDESKLPPADKGADGIGVIDIASRRLLRVMRGVSDPEQLAVSADGHSLFVASEDEGKVIVLDTKSGAVRGRVSVGAEAEGVNLSADGSEVYVTSEAEHRVTVIDAKKLSAVTNLDVGLRPRSTAHSRDGSRAYVMNEASGSVTVIDALAHHVLHTFALAGSGLLPMSGAVSPDGSTLYLTTGRAGKLLALDTGSGTIRGSITSGARPWGLAMSHDGTRLYAANGPSNDVSIVDATSWKLIATVPVGRKPWGVACAPESN